MLAYRATWPDELIVDCTVGTLAETVRARKLWKHAMLAADPQLARMGALEVDWYNGISYFVRQRPRIVQGVVLCADSPWACTFLTQAQLWPVDFARTSGDGTVHDKVSAVVANWERPGVLKRNFCWRYRPTPKNLSCTAATARPACWPTDAGWWLR